MESKPEPPPEDPPTEEDYFTNMGHPLPGSCIARYESVDLSAYKFPKYNKSDFHEMVLGVRYAGFVNYSDHLQKTMGEPPLDREIIDAAWYQVLVWNFREWDPRKYSKHFERGKELDGKQRMLIEAFHYETNNVIAWEEKSKKFPDVNCWIGADDMDDDHLKGYQIEFDLLVARCDYWNASIFAVEDIEYWAHKLTPDLWRFSLMELSTSGWIEHKLAEKAEKDELARARVLEEGQEALSSMALTEDVKMADV